MGYWQGAALGNALDAGAAEGKLNRQIQRNNELVDRVERDGHDAATWRNFQKGLENDKAPEATAVAYALFARTRPDLLPKTATLNQKRAKNLEIIAWAEFLTMVTYSASNISKQTAPKLGHLSDLLDGGTFDGKDISAALRDIANKTQIAVNAVYKADPQEWVEKRFNELRKMAKFKPNESMPVPSSITPTDEALQNMTISNAIEDDLSGAMNIVV